MKEIQSTIVAWSNNTNGSRALAHESLTFVKRAIITQIPREMMNSMEVTATEATTNTSLGNTVSRVRPLIETRAVIPVLVLVEK